MKLLMISGDRLAVAGKHSAFFYTLEKLAKHFEEINIITPRVSNARRAEGLPENVHFWPSSKSLWYQPWWIFKKGQQLVSPDHHDVMTVHEYPPFYNGLGARWLNKKTGIPYTSEIHHIVGWPRAASFSEWVGFWMSRFFLKWITKTAKQIRCVNVEVQQHLKAWGIESQYDFLDTSKTRTSVIPSFYLDRDALKVDPSIEKKYTVVFCARLVPNKRLGPVIDAVAALPGVSMLVIGDGPERELYEQRVRSEHLEDRIHFTGWPPTNNDVYHAMQSARIFVLNSTSEGGPRVAMEAMALGLPIISTDVGMLQMWRGNFEMTDGSTEQIKIAINNIIDDPKKFEEITLRMKNLMLTAFTRDALIDSYAKFLTDAHA